MKRSFILALVLLSTTGCCITKLILSGNGDPKTGVVGGKLEVTACTALEKEIANQVRRLSEWYQTEWRNCATQAKPEECRAQLKDAYNVQKDGLIALLEEMKGKPKEEQRMIYNRWLSRQLLAVK